MDKKNITQNIVDKAMQFDIIRLEEATISAENSYWLYDGVHPTTMGHAIIKREWLKVFEINEGESI